MIEEKMHACSTVIISSDLEICFTKPATYIFNKKPVIIEKDEGTAKERKRLILIHIQDDKAPKAFADSLKKEVNPNECELQSYKNGIKIPIPEDIIKSLGMSMESHAGKVFTVSWSSIHGFMSTLIIDLDE